MLDGYNVNEIRSMIYKRADEVDQICNTYISAVNNYVANQIENTEDSEDDSPEVQHKKFNSRYNACMLDIKTKYVLGTRLINEQDNVGKAVDKVTQVLTEAEGAKDIVKYHPVVADCKRKLEASKSTYTATFNDDNIQNYVEVLDEGEAKLYELRRLRDVCKERYPNEVEKLFSDELMYKSEEMGKQITEAKGCCSTEVVQGVINKIDTVTNALVVLSERITKLEQEVKGNNQQKQRSQPQEQPSEQFNQRQEQPKGYAEQFNQQQGQCNSYQEQYNAPFANEHQSQQQQQQQSYRASDMFNEAYNNSYNGTMSPLTQESPTASFDGKAPEVVTRSMGGNYYGRREITIQIMDSICDYFGGASDLSLITTFGYNKNGNIIVRDVIYQVNYQGVLQNLPPCVDRLIKQGRWSELLLFDTDIACYLAFVQVLSFGTTSQFVEFARQLGVGGGSIEGIARRLKNKKVKFKLLLPSLQDITVNGVSLLNEQQPMPTITPMSVNSSTMTAPKPTSRVNFDMADRAENLASRMSNGTLGAGETLKKLWDYPIFKVTTKVFGYGAGVPLGFSVLSMLHPFAMVCGVLGVGVLGVMEYKKVRNIIQS